MEKNSRSYFAFRNIAFGYLQQFILILLAFATKTIFIKKLSVSYAGIEGLFSSILSLLSLAELGTTGVFELRLYKAVKENDEEKIGQISFYQKKISYVIAVAIMGIGLCFLPFLKYIVKSEFSILEISIYYVLYLFNTAITYVITYKISILRSKQSLFVYNISYTITQIVQYLFQTIYLLISGNFLGFLIIQVSSTVLNVVAISVYTNKKYKFLSIKDDSKIDKKEMWSKTRANFINGACDAMVAGTDNILVSTFISMAAEGIFVYYNSLLLNIGSFISILMTGIIGSVGNANVENNKNLSYDVFIKSTYVFNAITAFCAVCYITNIQDFIPIWIGSEYLFDIDIVIAMVLNFYISHSFDSITIFCNTNDLFKEQTPAFICSAILNIALSIVMFKWLGMSGILFATSISKILTVIPTRINLLYKRIFNKSIKHFIKYQFKLLLTNMLCLFLVISLYEVCENSLIWIFARILICLIVFVIVHSILMRNDDGYIWVKQTIKSFAIRKR